MNAVNIVAQSRPAATRVPQPALPPTAADYEVRSAVGVLIFTSPDRRLALRYRDDHREDFPGLYVEEVLRWETRRRIGRAQLRAVA